MRHLSNRPSTSVVARHRAKSVTEIRSCDALDASSMLHSRPGRLRSRGLRDFVADISSGSDDDGGNDTELRSAGIRGRGVANSGGVARRRCGRGRF